MTATATPSGPPVTKSTTTIIISFSGLGDSDHVGIIIPGDHPRAYVGRATGQPYGRSDARPIRVLLDRVLDTDVLRAARFILVGDSITREQLYNIAGIDDIVAVNAVIFVSIGVDLLPILGLRQSRDEPMPSDAMLMDRVRRELGEGSWCWDIDQALAVSIGLAGAVKGNLSLRDSTVTRLPVTDLPATGQMRTSSSPNPTPRGRRSRPASEKTSEGRKELERPFFTVAEFSQMVGIDRSTAHRWISRGDLGYYRVGRQIRLRRQEVEIYLDRHRIASADEKAITARGRIVALPRRIELTDDEARGHQLADELGLK